MADSPLCAKDTPDFQIQSTKERRNPAASTLKFVGDSRDSQRGCELLHLDADNTEPSQHHRNLLLLAGCRLYEVVANREIRHLVLKLVAFVDDAVRLPVHTKAPRIRRCLAEPGQQRDGSATDSIPADPWAAAPT